MEIKNQVVSLELAKEMKELGASQDSVWYWAMFKDDSYLDVVGAIPSESYYQLIRENSFEEEQFNEIYSAYTVAELGEMLPDNYESSRLYDIWYCENVFVTSAKTEADARAKMWKKREREGML